MGVGFKAARGAAAIGVALCIHALLVPAGDAVDKSGVTPNTISLPQGPGSIEGLGESFQPTLATGTAKYQVGLTVPPGTAGHAPSIALKYDGGGSNGPLGFGWSVGVPSIQRQTDKGIPRYVDSTTGTDDDGFYFCENEGAFIR